MLNRDCTRYLPIVLTFIAGYGVIVLEEVLEIHKTATALILGVMVFLGQMDSTWDPGLQVGLHRHWRHHAILGAGPKLAMS